MRKPSPRMPVQPGTDGIEGEPVGAPGGSSLWRVALWVLVGLLLALTAVYYGTAVLVTPPPPETPEELVVTAVTPTVTHTRLATGTSTPTEAAPRFLNPTGTPTPPPGGASVALSPAAWAVGWVASNEERGNHFGDSNVYSGVFDGVIYHGAVQFDLSAVPRGAPIYYGSLELTGLDDDRLGSGGVWEVRVLSDTIEYEWPSADYQGLHNARAVESLAPALGSDDLGVRKVNAFHFSRGQLDLLEQRVLEEARVSFRIDGPLTGRNDLFSWDSGYGPTSQGAKPKLFLSIGQPPMTPPPREYAVVTNTPTPENVLTAAALIAQATFDATTTGTATPTPRNLATATPPGWIVVTNTPMPENAATAQILAFVATAEALTTGTATPTAPNVVTATWTPTPIVVTNTPTAENVFTAAAVAARITTDATTTGTATATPDNRATATPNDWIVVTSTPKPENTATAEYQRALVTAEAIAIGTATPAPANMVTATWTPTYVIITSVPTVGNISTAIAGGLFKTATAIAREGTPTPLPPNWVTPIVPEVTAVSHDPGMATVQAVQVLLGGFVLGTPTPTPPNLWTATPTGTLTPTPTYVIVTRAPTPGNISTAIARGLFETATAIAVNGTPTPLPPNWVTPIVEVDTPTPSDPSTATVQAALATLNAMLAGTPTPMPPNVVTATPTATYVVITSVPTPDNVKTAIARGLFETATAIAVNGTPTPLPPNWVTPVVLETTSTPASPAEATALAIQATVNAVMVGTPTPTPVNAALATATPWIVADAVVDPSPTPIPPDAIPPELVGRIAFMSDREGGEAAYYVMDADGGNVQRLSGAGVHEAALARERMSVPCLPPAAQDVWVRDTWLSNLRMTWSPACNWIAFASDRTLNEQVWVMDFRSTEDWGRTQINISNNPYNDWSPVWIKPPVVIEGDVTP